MTKENFINELSATIKSILGEDYQISRHVSLKDDGVEHISITFRKPDQMISPTIYVEDYFKQFEDGRDIKDIANAIIEIAQNNDNPVFAFDFNNIQKFDEVRPYLSVKLYGEQDRELLEKKSAAFIKVQNFLVTPIISIDTTSNNRGSVTITNELVSQWNITLENVIEAAIENLDAIEKYTFTDMAEIMRGMGMDMDIPELEKPSMIVLSNTSKVFGSNIMLCDEALSRLAKKIGEFFILPSSKHECIAIPKTDDTSAVQLLQIVRDTNATQVLPANKLTDAVYFYDNKLSVAAC